jgi:hypothetical protein
MQAHEELVRIRPDQDASLAAWLAYHHAPTDPDVPPRPVLLLQAIAERQRWKAEYAAAQLATSGSPPDYDCSATDDQAA